MKPNEYNGELIAVMSNDLLVRWFMSHIMAYLYSDYEFVDFDSTPEGCSKFFGSPKELKGKSFVWELPSRLLRLYEETFIDEVLSQELQYVAVIASSRSNMTERLLRLCTQRVDASLIRGRVRARLYDYRTGEKYLLSLRLE